MSVRFDVDSAVKPLVPYFNAGINQLTKLFYSKLNPLLDQDNRLKHAATFHYDVKVTLYNLASALTAYKAATLVFGFSNPISAISVICGLLFAREVIDRSLSVKANAKESVQSIGDSAASIVSNLLNQVRGKTPDSKEISIEDPLFTTLAITLSKANSNSIDSHWRENMFQIGGFTVLKNWHVTIPTALEQLGIA